MKTENKTQAAIIHKQQLLNSIFLKYSKKFYNDLKIHVREKEKRQSIYSDFLDMMLETQKNEKTFEETIPDYTAFLTSCVEEEKQNNIIKKQIIKFKKPLISILAVLTACVLVFVLLLSSGYAGFWKSGIYYILKSEKYTRNTYIIENVLDFDVNLKKDNENTVIYNDGVSKIEIDYVSQSMITRSEQSSEPGKIVSLTYGIKLKCTGMLTKQFAQICCSAAYGYDTIGNISVFSYSIGGIVYKGTIRTYSLKANATTEIELIVGTDGIVIDPLFYPAPPPVLYPEQQSAHSADEFIEILNGMDTVSVSLSGLVINQWVKK